MKGARYDLKQPTSWLSVPGFERRLAILTVAFSGNHGPRPAQRDLEVKRYVDNYRQQGNTKVRCA